MAFPDITPPMKMMNKKEEEMVLRSLEFFVDYKFSSGAWVSKEYAKRIEDIPQNDYAKLCKRLGGKARFEPAIEEKEGVITAPMMEME